MGNDPIVDFPAGFWDTHNPSNASLPIWLTVGPREIGEIQEEKGGARHNSGCPSRQEGGIQDTDGEGALGTYYSVKLLPLRKHVPM